MDYGQKRKLLSLIVLLSFISSTTFAAYLPITVEESDGSPSATTVRKLKVTSGTLTDDGNGTVTIDTSAGDSQWTTVAGPEIHYANNVGIGTTNPDVQLHVFNSASHASMKLQTTNGTGSPYLQLLPNTASGWEIGANYANGGNFYLDRLTGTGNIAIPDGNVGIGTTNPDSTLHVYQTTQDATPAMKIIDRSTLGTDLGFHFQNYGGTGDVVITNAGNIGVGTTAPQGVTSRFLEISGGSGNSDGGLTLTNPAPAGSSGFGQVNFYGATTQVAALTTWRDGANDAANLSLRTKPAGGALADRLTIKSDGNVGIGTTSPVSSLQIGSGAVPTGRKLTVVKADNNSDAIAAFYPANLSQGVGITYRGIQTAANSMYLEAAYEINMNTDGGVKIAGGPLLFATDNTYDIGASGATRPRTGYFGTNVISPALTGRDTDNTAVSNTAFWDEVGLGGIVRVHNQSDTANTASGIQFLTGSAADGVVGIANIRTGAGVGAMGFYTRNGESGQVPERMRLTAAGNLGIGSTAPGYKLDVAGDVNITGNFKINGSNVGLGSQWTTVNTNEIHYSSGNVGIGTSDPGNPLNVVNAGSTDGGSVMAIFGSGNPSTAGNIYNIAVDKWGVASLLLGVNKNTTTGSVPANSTFITTNAANQPLSLGRGGGGGAPGTSDVFIEATTGNVGIGTTDPAYLLDVAGSLNVSSGMNLTHAGSADGSASMAKLGSGNPATAGNVYSLVLDKWGTASLIMGINKNTATGSVPGNSTFISTNDASQTLSIGRGGSGLPNTSDIFINASGNVGIGTTSPAAVMDIAHSNTSDSLKITQAAASSYPFIPVRKARGTVASPTVISSGDELMGLRGFGHDGSTYVDGAAIDFVTEGTIATNRIPTSIRFATHPDSTTAITERMRIDPSGDVGIGSTDPQYKLDVVGDVNITGNFKINGSNVGLGSQWTTAGSEIYFSDNVGIGTTDPGATLDVRGTGISVTTIGGNYGMVLSTIGDAAIVSQAQNRESLRASSTGTLSANRTLPVIGATRAVALGGFTDTSAVLKLDNGNTGATGNIFEWTGTGVSQGVIDSSGDVGIGTTAPAQKLDVVGNTAITGAYVSGNDFSGVSRQGFRVVKNITDGTGDQYGVVSSITNTSGAGVTNAAGGIFYVPAVSGAGSAITNSYGLWISNPGGGTNNYGIYQDNATPKNYFAGNVGIGTTDPISVKTRIAGSMAKATASTQDVLYVTTSDAAASYPLGLVVRMGGSATSTDRYVALQSTQIGTSPDKLSLNPDGGNVGIGTTGPGSRLHIYNANADTTTPLNIHTGGTDTGGLRRLQFQIDEPGFTNYAFRFYADAGTGFYGWYKLVNGVENSSPTLGMVGGNVGIGTTAPESTYGTTLTVANTGASPVSSGVMVKGNVTAGTNTIGGFEVMNGSSRQFAIQAFRNGGDTTTGATFYTSSAGTLNTAAMTILGSGNVGIGTTGPGNLLALYGGSIEIMDKDFGNGSRGPFVQIGRNSNATQTAAGTLRLTEKDGTIHQLWVDNSNQLRIYEADGPPSVSDTAGTVIGTQTSSLDSKKLSGEFTDHAGALQAILDAPLYNFTYKSGAYLNQEFTGIITDYSPVFGMDRDEAHPAGKSLNVVTGLGYTFAAIKELNAQIEALKEENASQSAKNAELEARLAAIEERLAEQG